MMALPAKTCGSRLSLEISIIHPCIAQMLCRTHMCFQPYRVNWFVEVLIRSSSERLIFQLYICREIVSDCPLSNAQCLCALRQALNIDERTGDKESCNQELECRLHDEGVDARRISRSISELLVDGAIISCPRILVKTDSCIIHFCCNLIFQLLAFSTGIKICSPWSPTQSSFRMGHNTLRVIKCQGE